MMITATFDNAQLPAVKARPPEGAGAYWRPVPHADLLKTIKDRATARHWTVGEPVVSLSVDQADMAASVPVYPHRSALDLAALGVVSSNARRRRMKFYFGVLTEAGGGIILDAFQPAPKGDSRSLWYRGIIQDVDEALDWVDGFRSKVPGIVRTLQKQKRTADEVEHLLMTTVRRGLVPGGRMMLIDRKLADPITDWSLLQAFSEVALLSPPLKTMDCVLGFRRLLEAKA